jgi:hypothetical protein
MSLNTPLHLSRHRVSTSLLLSKGACFLVQDFHGQAAGLANEGAAVVPWLRRLFVSEGRWISLITRRKVKKFPKGVSAVIFSFLVQMHLANHVDQAMAQELSPNNCPIVAFSMTKNELWPIHGTTILIHTHPPTHPPTPTHPHPLQKKKSQGEQKNQKKNLRGKSQGDVYIHIIYIYIYI